MTPWLALHRLIRSLTSTTWDAATWPQAKAVLREALAMRSRMAREGWWN